MAGHIIHLIGFNGVGKLTIAKEMVRQQSHFVLVDNQLINKSVFSVMNTDGKTKLSDEVWQQMSKIGAVVLDTMKTLSPSHLSFVMTNFLIDDEENKAECRIVEAIAVQRGGLYFPVILMCDAEENRRRIVSPERSLNLKCIDPDEPDRARKGKPLLRCDGHLNRVEMDVTHIQPADSAERILQEVGRDRVPWRSSAVVSGQP